MDMAAISSGAFDSPLRMVSTVTLQEAGTSVATAIDLTAEEHDNDERYYIRPSVDNSDIAKPSTGHAMQSQPSPSPPNRSRLSSRTQKQKLVMGQASAVQSRPSKRIKKNSYQSMAQKATLDRRKRLQQNSPEVMILSSHRDLNFWKNQFFNALKIKKDLELATHAATLFDKTTITTVVPNRYLERPLLPSVNVFPGTLKVESPIKAIEEAYKESTIAKLDINRLVLWTDGSGCQRGKQGFAFAWRYSEVYGWGPWRALGYKVATAVDVSSNDMEFLAVIKALDWASEVAQNRVKSVNAVTIYTDAQAVIVALQQNLNKRPLALQIVKRATKLIRLGVSDISIHWVPGHSKVPGNELADKVAGYANAHAYKSDKELIDLSDDEGGE